MLGGLGMCLKRLYLAGRSNYRDRSVVKTTKHLTVGEDKLKSHELQICRSLLPAKGKSLEVGRLVVGYLPCLDVLRCIGNSRHRLSPKFVFIFYDSSDQQRLQAATAFKTALKTYLFKSCLC